MTPQTKRITWLLLIFLAAASLRLYNLSDVPPGLTHDEANHGQDAWGVVNGIRPIYFTVGYGREPLYDYSTAVLMSFLGPTYLAGRLTSVYFSLILIAGVYAWVRAAFDEKTALLTAAGLAVSFWATMTARHGLRTVTQPALFVMAVCFFWYGIKEKVTGHGQATIASFQSPVSRLAHFLLAGVLFGLTFYTYFPARIMWLVLLLLLIYLALFDRPLLARVWRGTAVTLVVAAAVGLPLLVYLYTNASVEVRLEELSTPLAAAANGDFRPLLQNTAASLRLLTIQGDDQWRYNIPGRPFVPLLLIPFFYLGLIIALWQALPLRRSQQGNLAAAAAFVALVWLALGLLPAFITGPSLSTTRIIGLQPVLFLFPALALTTLDNYLQRYRQGDQSHRRWPTALLLFVLYAAVLAMTARDYFAVWNSHPEVRVHYETTLVTAVRYLNEHGHGPAAISTTTPDRFHSPGTAFLTLHNEAVSLRWFNGQRSLLLPQDTAHATLIFSGFARLNPNLTGYFDLATGHQTLPLRPIDKDRPLTIYRVDGPAVLASWRNAFDDRIDQPGEVTMPVHFGQAADFLGYVLQTPSVAPEGWVRLVTLWQVKQPLTEALLFSQVLGDNGNVVAQEDRLDVPSYYWYPGDVFIQLHEFQIPAGLAPGEYPLIIGLYTRPDQQRLPIMANENIAGDHLRLRPLTVTP